jgi:hypothetical protein
MTQLLATEPKLKELSEANQLFHNPLARWI